MVLALATAFVGIVVLLKPIFTPDRQFDLTIALLSGITAAIGALKPGLWIRGACKWSALRKRGPGSPKSPVQGRARWRHAAVERGRGRGEGALLPCIDPKRQCERRWKGGLETATWGTARTPAICLQRRSVLANEHIASLGGRLPANPADQGARARVFC
jgi:hypothetical protein